MTADRTAAERIARAACEAAGIDWRTLPLTEREAAVWAVLDLLRDLSEED